MNRWWVALIAAVALTLILAPSQDAPPARPEPGVQRVLATVFGDPE